MLIKLTMFTSVAGPLRWHGKYAIFIFRIKEKWCLPSPHLSDEGRKSWVLESSISILWFRGTLYATEAEKASQFLPFYHSVQKPNTPQCEWAPPTNLLLFMMWGGRLKSKLISNDFENICLNYTLLLSNWKDWHRFCLIRESLLFLLEAAAKIVNCFFTTSKINSSRQHVQG